MRRENKMTNLEYYASKGFVTDTTILCNIAYVCKYGIDCVVEKCSKCEFNDNLNLCVQTLLKEHKESIKLKQWEYDFLNTLRKYHATTFMSDKFNEYLCDDMKQKGHFKGVHDKTMTLQEILDNCEVVEDD